MSFGVSTKGIYPIAATPFKTDMAVDFTSVDRLTDFYQDAGATGMTILGILGEAQKLEPEEFARYRQAGDRAFPRSCYRGRIQSELRSDARPGPRGHGPRSRRGHARSGFTPAQR